MHPKERIKTAILIADPNFTSIGNDKNLLQIYGESILQITYYKLREIFDKMLVVVNNFDQQSIYSKQLGEDVIVNLNKNKNELTSALAGLQACSQILGADCAFILKANMPLVEKKAVNLILEKEPMGFNAYIPRHANGKMEFLTALYRVKPALTAFERAAKDEKTRIADSLNYLSMLFIVPVNEIIKADPQLLTFFAVESEIDYQKAKEKMQGKVFRSRIKKAEKIKGEIIKESETATTIYFKVPGTEEEHEVRYSKRTKKWNCDCRHFTMKATHCSHILAAQGKI